MTKSSSRETVDETLRSSQEALNRLHDVLRTTETRLRVSRRLLERPGDADTERSDSETHERWVPPMNANVAPTHWQRTHANRWVAEVTATPGGGYKYLRSRFCRALDRTDGSCRRFSARARAGRRKGAESRVRLRGVAGRQMTRPGRVLQKRNFSAN